MEYPSILTEEKGGFSFENVARNAALMGVANKFKTAKSGTTICGLVCGKDAVVIGADTRATNGPIIADKNCNKIHRLADNIFCGGAGTAADLEHTTAMIESQLELHKLSTGFKPRVATAVRRLSSHLYKYQGHVGCALVLGGFDLYGPQLYQIYPHGSTDCLPFTAMGSGSLAAMAVLESGYRDDLTPAEGAELVRQAIRSGVFNDLGSGGNVDVIVITADGKADHRRPFDQPNPRLFRQPVPVSFPAGTTPLIGEASDVEMATA